MLRSKAGISINHRDLPIAVVGIVLLVVGPTGKIIVVVAVENDAAPPPSVRPRRHALDDDTGMLRLHHEFAILCLFDPSGDDAASRFGFIGCWSSVSFFFTIPYFFPGGRITDYSPTPITLTRVLTPTTGRC